MAEISVSIIFVIVGTGATVDAWFDPHDAETAGYLVAAERPSVV